MACTRFAVSASVTSVWACSSDTVIGALPVVVHSVLRAARSSTCTVPACTPTALPHRSSALMPSGLPVFTARLVPAVK